MTWDNFFLSIWTFGFKKKIVLDHEVQKYLSINILEIFYQNHALILTAENEAKINGKNSKNPSMPLFVEIFQILHPKAYINKLGP